MQAFLFFGSDRDCAQNAVRNRANVSAVLAVNFRLGIEVKFSGVCLIYAVCSSGCHGHYLVNSV
jgi:hypothetical protein